MRRFVCIHPFFCVYCLLFKKWATFAWELASKRSSLKSVDVSRCCAPMELHSHCECQTFLFACRRICAFSRCIKVELCDESTVFVLLEKYRVFRNGFILKTQWTEVHIWLSHFRFFLIKCYKGKLTFWRTKSTWMLHIFKMNFIFVVIYYVQIGINGLRFGALRSRRCEIPPWPLP